MKIELTKTLDGSHTLYLPAIDEHYHSTFGAIQESAHVFISSGLHFSGLKKLEILEVGFGTGLNCYLTLLAGIDSDHTINYHAIEKYPVSPSLLEKLNFFSYFPSTDPDLFARLHRGEWNRQLEIYPRFTLHKMEADLLQINMVDLPGIDLVYFDAFSPEKQPELWEQIVFERIFAQMNQGGILVTYCAKGAIRRLLQQVGFKVDRIPGPPGKREMIRALKN